MSVECKGKNEQDCWKCGKYFAWQSLHYNKYFSEHVSEFSCSIGGHRVFNEDGEMIDKT